MHCVVIGSGFTGTMIATHLLRRSGAPVRVSLVERAPRFATGVAYSTPHGCHLLNVPAGRMSAFPDDEEHFFRWARGRDPSVHGGTFLPRRLYSQYLGDILSEAESCPASGSTLQRVATEAVSIDAPATGPIELRCANGLALRADAAVLAIGNYPPANPACRTPEFYSSSRYHQDPWLPGALDVREPGDILLLGTGLTMIDAAVALREQGLRGRIIAVSRRGLLPQTHREINAAPPHIPPPESWERWPTSATGICREIRGEIVRAELAGVDWRDVVTSLRPITCDLWRALPPGEKRRFLTHLRPFFETHRHRTAPAIGRIIEEMRASGALIAMGARVVRYDPAADGIKVTIRRRGGESEENLRVARVINCTGPDTDLSRVKDPLVRTLRDRGMIRPDALGLGLDSDDHGHVIDARGRLHERLYLAGPLRRGLLWENIAVPELREEAARLAQHLLGRPPGSV